MGQPASSKDNPANSGDNMVKGDKGKGKGKATTAKDRSWNERAAAGWTVGHSAWKHGRFRSQDVSESPPRDDPAIRQSWKFQAGLTPTGAGTTMSMEQVRAVVKKEVGAANNVWEKRMLQRQASESSFAASTTKDESTIEINDDDNTASTVSVLTNPHKDSPAAIAAKSQIATLNAMLSTLVDKTDDYVVSMEKDLRARIKQLSIQITKSKDLPQQINTLKKAKERRHALLMSAQEDLKEAQESVQEANQEYEIVAAELQSVLDQQFAEQIDQAAASAQASAPGPVIVTAEHLQAITIAAASIMPQHAVALQEMLQHVATHMQPNHPVQQQQQHQFGHPDPAMQREDMTSGFLDVNVQTAFDPYGDFDAAHPPPKTGRMRSVSPCVRRDVSHSRSRERPTKTLRAFPSRLTETVTVGSASGPVQRKVVSTDFNRQQNANGAAVAVSSATVDLSGTAVRPSL